LGYNELFNIKQLEEGDITLLVSARIFSHVHKETIIQIDNLKKMSGKGNIFLATQNKIIVLCGFSSIDSSANQANIWVYPSESNWSAKYGDTSNEVYSIFLSKVFSFLAYEAFYKKNLHKIYICVKDSEVLPISILEKHRWKKEGVLVNHFYERYTYFDGLNYAMFQKDFFRYSTSLITFLTGYLIVRATNDSVFGISIIKEGDFLPSFINDDFECKNQVYDSDNKIIHPLGARAVYVSPDAYQYLSDASIQLLEYINKTRTSFDLTYEYSNATFFQKQVWEATIAIPYGETRNYEEIAYKIKPNGKNSELRLLSRAVGTALGKNPIMIAIPCHRVIGKDRKLKGFAGGLEVKDYLLSSEILMRKEVLK